MYLVKKLSLGLKFAVLIARDPLLSEIGFIGDNMLVRPTDFQHDFRYSNMVPYAIINI